MHDNNSSELEIEKRFNDIKTVVIKGNVKYVIESKRHYMDSPVENEYKITFCTDHDKFKCCELDVFMDDEDLEKINIIDIREFLGKSFNLNVYYYNGNWSENRGVKEHYSVVMKCDIIKEK